MCWFQGIENWLFPLIFYFPSGPPFSTDCFELQNVCLLVGFRVQLMYKCILALVLIFSMEQCHTNLLSCLQLSCQVVRRLLGGSGTISAATHRSLACFLTQGSCRHLMQSLSLSIKLMLLSSSYSLSRKRWWWGDAEHPFSYTRFRLQACFSAQHPGAHLPAGSSALAKSNNVSSLWVPRIWSILYNTHLHSHDPRD